MKYLVLEEVDSTNSYVSSNFGELENMTMVIADRQTAGRGQRGNSWESEPGKNLTFTLFFKPEGLEPRNQFSISEATALAVADTLRDMGIEATVKWPNDVYAGDRKIAGILIEHSVTSHAIEHSRIGVGLNLNQKEFRSDAPNPVSAVMLTGRETEINRAAAMLGLRLEERLSDCSSEEGRRLLHEDFLRNLWRGDGRPHPFRLRGNSEAFPGIITDVDPAGPISVKNAGTGEINKFAFKEIEFVI